MCYATLVCFTFCQVWRSRRQILLNNYIKKDGDPLRPILNVSPVSLKDSFSVAPQPEFQPSEAQTPRRRRGLRRIGVAAESPAIERLSAFRCSSRAPSHTTSSRDSRATASDEIYEVCESWYTDHTVQFLNGSFACGASCHLDQLEQDVFGRMWGA